MPDPSERIKVEAEPFDPAEEARGGESGGQAGARPKGDRGPRPQRQRSERGSKLAWLLSRRYGTIVAGALLDAVDFTTLGAIGMKLGFPIGFACGWWLARELGYPKRLRLGIAAGCGLYCMYPPTTFLPVATVLGVMASKLGLAPNQQE